MHSEVGSAHRSNLSMTKATQSLHTNLVRHFKKSCHLVESLSMDLEAAVSRSSGIVQLHHAPLEEPGTEAQKDNAPYNDPLWSRNMSGQQSQSCPTSVQLQVF